MSRLCNNGRMVKNKTIVVGHMSPDTDSIIADPMFINAANFDFRLKPDSPVLKTGFKPFDYSKAGVYGDPAWLKKAQNVEFPPLELPPQP